MPEAPSPCDLLSAGTNEGIQEARAQATREAEIVLKTAREKIRKSQNLIARVNELLARR